MRSFLPAWSPVLFPTQSDTTLDLRRAQTAPRVPITLNQPSPLPYTHTTNAFLIVQGPGRELEWRVSEECSCLELLPLSVGQRSPETHPPPPLPTAQAAWLPTVSLLCGSLSVQSPGEGRPGFPVRGLKIGVGVYWMWRGESPAPSGKIKGEEILRAWSLSRLDLGTAKGLDTKAPKSQRPLPFPARPGEKITVIDDSNEEWWRVREM